MPATFHSLKHHDFRALWLGLALSASGSWLQLVGQGLLVLRLSGGSAPALGAVSLAQGLAFFGFVLLGGALADRLEPRRILWVTQSVSLCLALALSLLTFSGLVTVGSLVVLAFLGAAASSFDGPARAALLPRLVPHEDLANAVALQTLAFNTAATLGPTLAGAVVVWLGFGGTFLLNALSFVGVLLALASMRVPGGTRRDHKPLTLGALLRSSREGVRAVRRSPVLTFVLGSCGVMLLVGPSTSFLLLLLATQVLGVGGAQLGLMFSAAGLGTVTGALVTASLPRLVRQRWFLLAGLALWSAALLSVAALGRYWPTLPALFVWGGARNAVGVAATSVMQLYAPDALRGRVMSLNTLVVMGARPLGDFGLSLLISAFSVSAVAVGGAAVVGVYAGVSALRRGLEQRAAP